MKHFQLNPSSVFSTRHLAGSDIISHLMLKSQQPAAILKIARYPSKRSYHFQPNSSNKCWMSSPVVWNHPSDLIGFCPKQTAFPDSWDRFFMIVVIVFLDSWDSFFIIAVTTFPDSWDNLFRTAMTADPIAWTLLIFPYLAKTKSKTNYCNYLSLAKILSFSATLSLAALTKNSKNTLKLNIPFLAKYYDGFSEDSLLFGTDFGWYSLPKYPFKLSSKKDHLLVFRSLKTQLD